MEKPMAIDYAKALRLARASRDLTQKEAAAKAGISSNYLSTIEGGQRAPTTAVIEALAHALGIPVWALVVIGSPDSEAPAEVVAVAYGMLVNPGAIVGVERPTRRR
jgi:transcriptional regulator with XRE-family HTH domain